jgi:hypothetical protein
MTKPHASERLSALQNAAKTKAGHASPLARTYARRRDDALEFAASAEFRAAEARLDAMSRESAVGREMATQRAEDEARTADHYRKQAANWAAKLATVSL